MAERLWFASIPPKAARLVDVIVAGGSLLLSLPCAMSSADLAHHDPVDLMPAEEVAAGGTVHDLSFFHRIIGAPR